MLLYNEETKVCQQFESFLWFEATFRAVFSLRVRASPNVYVDHQPGDDDNIQLNETKPELERWMEAQILPGDTLQAIALRFNCTVK